MSVVEVTEEDRRQHLSMIQGAVLRMSTASSTSKSWLLPVVTAAYGYAVVQTQPGVALLGLLAVLVFAALDAHYLRLERAFRALFRRTVLGAVAPYEMNPRPYFRSSNGDADDLREENCRWSKVIWSWSIAGFYGAFAIAGFVIALAGIVIGLSEVVSRILNSVPCLIN